MNCGLCGADAVSLFYQDIPRKWDYYSCDQCSLIFKDPSTYIGPSEEKARYATHNNSVEDKGYLAFLQPAVDTLLPYLTSTHRGLDFGCGPGPVMDYLLAQHGIEVVNYDPYFANEPQLLQEAYDFITCTEAFEHFYHPGQEMSRLHQLLKPNGHLLLMSDFHKGSEHFANWSYRMDNTHVCFLSHESLRWLSTHWGFEVLSTDGRVSLLRKKS